MRALCGAIITAGALIGLGLISMGIGTRYSEYPYRNRETGEVQWVLLRNMDTALVVALTAAIITLIIGLAIAFLGLAYHHHRRHLELHRGDQPPPPRTTASERITV
jgi:hypothetical protein